MIYVCGTGMIYVCDRCGQQHEGLPLYLKLTAPTQLESATLCPSCADTIRALVPNRRIRP